MYVSVPLELRQLRPVAPDEFLVDVSVGVVAHFGDLVAPKTDHHARPLVHHVLRMTLEPPALTDLDDDAILGVVRIAPYVSAFPIGRSEAGLAVPQCIEHVVAAVPFAADRRRARHPVHDVILKQLPDGFTIAGEEGLLIGFGELHAAAHAITSSSASSGSGSVFALRPARSIGLSNSALCWSMIVQKSSARSRSSYDASRRVSLIFTWRTLFCMSSASHPRECAMNGNGGNTNPSSAQKVNIEPATAWMLSWPPVMMNAATLFLMSTVLRIVTWFCTQFRRSIIL